MGMGTIVGFCKRQLSIGRRAMTVEFVRQVLAWCSLFNLIILMVWFLGFRMAGEGMYRVHSKWFAISKETFDAIHYAGMTFFKLTFVVFNLVPYLVLRMLV